MSARPLVLVPGAYSSSRFRLRSSIGGNDRHSQGRERAWGRLRTASFSPALDETFAIVTRPGPRLSAGAGELLGDPEVHMRAVADEFDRSR